MSFSKGKVYQYDVNGNFINEYQNTSEAQFLTSINNLCPLLNGLKNMSSAGGYLWTKIYYIKLPKEIIQKYENRNFEKYNVPIFEYDMNGILLNEYESLSQITKIRKERNNIRSVLKGENKTFKDKIYKFKKYKKLPKSILKEHFNKWPRSIIQYNLKGKKIKEWSSAYDASTSLKISRTNINRCLKKEKLQANGYIWKYK